jgi:UDP-2-acetamido-3-amino-2,3-dideoxy-glucuronate N-acetyltransferase
VRTPVTIGVAGLDDWGLCAARAFSELPRADLRWLCPAGADLPLRKRIVPPAARRTDEITDLLDDEMLDALVVAVPLDLRPELIRRALHAGKHVLTRSPMTVDGAEADELAKLAEQHNLRLLAACDLLFEPAVQRLKDLLEVGRLGDVNYMYTARHRGWNESADALWDVAALDVPVILHLLDDEPVEVSCRAESYVENGSADVVFCHLRFASGICAHLHASSLEPRTTGRLTVVGSDRLAVLDATEFEQRLILHEKGRRPGPATVHTQAFDDGVLGGWNDALHRECEYFLSVVRTPVEHASARQGSSVVNVLEALARSLRSGSTESVRERAPQVSEITALADRRARR